MTEPEKPPAPPKGEHVVPKKAVDYYGANVIALIRRQVVPPVSVPVLDPLDANLKAGIEEIAKAVAENSMRRARETKDHPKGVKALTEPRWLSGRADVGRYLGVSGRQASKLRTQYRDFPAKIIDGRLTANTADLDAWMRKREHTCAVCGKTVQNETSTFALPHPQI